MPMRCGEQDGRFGVTRLMSVNDIRAAKNSAMAGRSPGHRMGLVTRCDVDEASV